MQQANNKKFFKAIIRVVKSLSGSNERFTFGNYDIVKEPCIEAESKQNVKDILLEKYPQFFQNGKVYEKETKDVAQFFYVLIYPLYQFEIDQINEGSWICSYCGHVHENKYISRPRMNERLLGTGVMFCRSEEDICMNGYKREKNKDVELPDDESYIKKDSPIYIYKCTEKETGKSYIGKTRNAPFFRWWNHLTHSISPFGMYLKSSKLSNWTFEVLRELPFETPENEVFRIESDYMLQFDSIANGFNSLISNKESMKMLDNENVQPTLFNNSELTIKA